jgi:O-antigen ligase
MIPKRPKQVGALLLTALITFWFTGPELYERYASTFAEEKERDASAESRVDLWRDCLKVVAEYPMFGVGPTNWRFVAARYGWPEGKSAHSVWMETAAEVGIPGALVLLCFFGFAAIRLWPIARARLTDTNRYEVILASGVILSIVGFSVSGQFVSVPGLEVPYYVVMLGAAMLKTARPKLAPAVAPAPAKSAGRVTLAPPVRALQPIRSGRPAR